MNNTMIHAIRNEDISYTVGQDNITRIERSKNGTTKKTTMYKVTYEDDSVLFVGMLDHEIMRRLESE